MSPRERPWLRVLLDYRCYPTWIVHPDGGEDNPAPQELGLPDDLAADLNAWSDEFDAIFQEDPSVPIFPSAQAQAAFDARGRRLAERVASTAGDRYRVTYYDPQLKREVAIFRDQDSG